MLGPGSIGLCTIQLIGNRSANRKVMYNIYLTILLNKQLLQLFFFITSFTNAQLRNYRALNFTYFCYLIKPLPVPDREYNWV